MNRTIHIAMIGLGLCLMAGCSEPTLQAPDEHNTCFHIGYPKGSKPRFNVIKKDIKSIEYCAVELEQLRMEFARQGVPATSINGAYNGNFLFIEGRFIRMGRTYDGPTFTLLVKTDDGRLVKPGTIVQDEPFSDNQPITVPKNLPH